jgi:hypothetical protein
MEPNNRDISMLEAPLADHKPQASSLPVAWALR